LFQKQDKSLAHDFKINRDTRDALRKNGSLVGTTAPIKNLIQVKHANCVLV
jgi:hypothetical protein